MNGPVDNSDYVEPSVGAEERDELIETARLLEASRPLPPPAFRGRLRRDLLSREDRFSRGAQVRARRSVLAYGGSGTVLLAVAAAGLAGLGPFGA